MQEHCSIIGKLLSGINRKQFKRIVDKYDGDRYVKYFNCWSQFVCIFIGQISLRLREGVRGRGPYPEKKKNFSHTPIVNFCNNIHSIAQFLNKNILYIYVSQMTNIK